MIDRLIKEHKELTYLKDSIRKTVDAIKGAYNKGGKVMVCGNGGSCADADHIVGELMKGFLSKRPITPYEENLILNQKYDNGNHLIKSLQRGIPAISLNTHGALISAVINDIDADMMFAQQVFGIGTESDVLIGISTGGGAENVINALKVGRAIGCTTIGMTGNRHGKMNDFCDILLDVPVGETYQIQEYHIAIYHAFCAEAEKELF